VIAGEGSAGGKFVPKCGTAARLELALRAPAGQSSLEKNNAVSAVWPESCEFQRDPGSRAMSLSPQPATYLPAVSLPDSRFSTAYSHPQSSLLLAEITVISSLSFSGAQVILAEHIGPESVNRIELLKPARGRIVRFSVACM
jgi:hypothetical protein